MGLYQGVYVRAEGRDHRMEDYFSGDSFLELLSKGKARLVLGNNTHELTWKEEEGTMTFTQGEDSFLGTFHEGIIVMDYMGWGLELTFVIEGAELPSTLSPVELDPEELTAALDFWNGAWTGDWTVTEASGDYSSQGGQKLPVSASIRLEQDARGTLEIWETDSGEPLAECILRVDLSEGEHGIALSGQGSFRGSPVSSGDWLIDPATSRVPGELEIYGYYTDETGDYFYTVRLNRTEEKE